MLSIHGTGLEIEITHEASDCADSTGHRQKHANRKSVISFDVA